ncbi:MAG: insulinase family protein [Bacteroidota bacterium]
MKSLFRLCTFLSLFLSLILYQACTPKTKTVASSGESELIGVAASEAPTAPAPPQNDFGKNVDIPVDADIRMGTLPNGMKYYIRKNTKPEDRAELRLAVNAGAMQEDEDQQGLAHFVEHMAFNGSKNFSKNELVDYLETIGTKFGPDLNAYTSFDETVYMLQARTDDAEMLNKGLTVLQDWASGVSFDHEEIDKERGVVESEWRSRLSPNQRMLNQWLPVMYKDSRYAQRLPIGKPEIIRNASYETVKRFYNDWYRPELMAVVIVGDVNVDEMEKEIVKRFTPFDRETPARSKENNDVPDHKETLVSICSDKEASFTNVQLMYKHDHIPTEDMQGYRSSIVRRLYNAMLSARLDELAQKPNPPFTYAYTGYSRDVGDLDTYSSYAMAPEGGAMRCLEVILEENERVLRHGFNASEMERQKTQLLKRMERAFKEKDKTESRRFAMRYVYNYLEGTPIPSIDDELEFYKTLLPTIQLNEVNSLAAQWITEENRVVVITGPEKEGLEVPTEAEVSKVLAAVSKKDIAPYEDEVSDAPLLAKIPTPVEIVAVKEMENVGVTEMKLANGVRVILKPTDFKNDEVLLRAYSIGGSSIYSDADYVQASNAARIIDEAGLGSFDNPQLQKKLTGKTISISPYIGELYEGFRGSASPDDLETMMQLIYLYFTAPRKDKDVLNSYVTKQKSIYSNLMSNPQYYFFDQVTKILSNDHPRRGFPKAEDLDRLDLEQVHKIYNDRFADASDFTFVFVGNFNMEQMKPLLKTYLSNLPATQREESWKDVGDTYPSQKIEKQFAKGKAPKALVNLTFHGDFEWNGQNRYDFRSMLDVLRIKMRESMREDKGGVYGVRVSGSPSHTPRDEYSITISFNADPPMVEELIQTAMKDIETAKSIGAEEKDLDKVRETQRQSRIKDLKENRFWARQLESFYKNGYDPTKLTQKDFEEYVNKLDAEAVKKAANQYFNTEKYVRIVMLPEEVAEN